MTVLINNWWPSGPRKIKNTYTSSTKQKQKDIKNDKDKE